MQDPGAAAAYRATNDRMGKITFGECRSPVAAHQAVPRGQPNRFRVAMQGSRADYARESLQADIMRL